MTDERQRAEAVSYTHLDVYKRQLLTYFSQLPIPQQHRAELNLVAVAQLQAVFGDLAAVDERAAGAAGVVDAVVVTLQAQNGVEAGDGDVVAEGDLALGGGAADAHFQVAQRQLFGHERLGVDDLLSLIHI